MITSVNGAKYCPPGSKASESEEPIPPAKPPIAGPNVNDAMKTMMSPALNRCPGTPGIGVLAKVVMRSTRAVVVARTTIFTVGVLRPDEEFCLGSEEDKAIYPIYDATVG